MVKNLILSALWACGIHEGGHYAAALCFGRRIEFSFRWGWLWGTIPIPRYIWWMPNMERRKQRAVAISGFGAEFLAAPIFIRLRPEFGWIYLAFATLHLALYPFYCGESSDFKWFKR